MKKFLIVDDHFVVRSGMSGLLADLYKACEVDEAENANSATEN